MTTAVKNFIKRSSALSLLILISACASHSTISIPAKEEFVLGELEQSNFTVLADNISKTSLQVITINSKNKQTINETIVPKQERSTIKVSKTDALLFKNPTDKTIKVKVRLNKGVEGMRYQSILPTNQKLLKKDSLINDLILLEKALTTMHPGIYRYNTPDQIKELFENLKNNLPLNVQENDFMVQLAQTIKQLKCGHTYLNPWNLNKDVRGRLFGHKTYFPIGFKILDGKFYSTENATKNTTIKRGAEILTINGIPTNSIYNKLKTIAKTDGNNTSSIDHYLSLWNYDKSNWHAFDLYFQLFYPLTGNSFEVTFQNYGESSSRKTSITAMTKEERAKKMKFIYSSAILEKETWNLNIVSSELAIIKLGTFAIWNWKNFDHKKWFAETFKKLDSLQINKLAIDIRGNGGGLTEPANELMSYLIKDTLKCKDLGKVFIRTTKFDSELLPYINSWVEPLKVGLPKELYKPSAKGLYELLIPTECSDISPKQSRFLGKIFILGGPSNVSATYTLLEKANQFNFATFVGQESGGNRQGINGGEYAFFTMPYSKMEVDIPLKYFASSKESTDAGVLPKITIKYTQKDIATNFDPYLDYVNKE